MIGMPGKLQSYRTENGRDERVGVERIGHGGTDVRLFASDSSGFLDELLLFAGLRTMNGSACCQLISWSVRFEITWSYSIFHSSTEVRKYRTANAVAKY